MAEPTLEDRLVTSIQGLVTGDQGIEIKDARSIAAVIEVEHPASSGIRTGAP
jgi:cytoskeletal protein CcmA (bactofilin family)